MGIDTPTRIATVGATTEDEMARRKAITPQELTEFVERVSEMIDEAHEIEAGMQSDFQADIGASLDQCRTMNAAIKALSEVQIGLLTRLSLAELRRETRAQLA